MNVYVNKKRIKITPRNLIGQGGEAEVYDIGGGLALKLYKQPTHPDFIGSKHLQAAVKDRLKDLQEKLCAFPLGLPESVITPIELAGDKSGKTILGYTMKAVPSAEVLMRFSERAFRQRGVEAATVSAIFQCLHATLEILHQKDVIIGDFNDLNVLVRADQPYLIDTDSFQFGLYPCTVFTERFVDPLLCDAEANAPILQRPFNRNSDWYAFMAMLFRSLLLVDPFGGVYKPKDLSLKVPQSARSLRRITVFDSDVKYPKPAYRYDILPDGLLQYFHQVFAHDKRGAFPIDLLEDIDWQRCSSCGMEHARRACPVCATGTPVQVLSVLEVTGPVEAQWILRTEGQVVAVATEGDSLRWLTYEKGGFVREDGQTVFNGILDPSFHFELERNRTWVGRGSRLLSVKSGEDPSAEVVETFEGVPQFVTGQSGLIFLRAGQLVRKGVWGSEGIGETLAGQTRIWMGPRFGFGLYRAGQMNVAFVFGAKGRGLNDSLKLPPLPGQWVQAHCVFSNERCWFSVARQHKGKVLTDILVFGEDGIVEAQEHLVSDQNEWCASLAGACAVGSMLLVPTDEGLVRVEVVAGRIVKTRSFPDTEPYMDSASRLMAAPRGLYVVSLDSILHVTMK